MYFSPSRTELPSFFYTIFAIFVHFFEFSSFPSSLVVRRSSALRASSDPKTFIRTRRHSLVTLASYFTFWRHSGHVTTSRPLLLRLTSSYVIISPNFSVSPNFRHNFSEFFRNFNISGLLPGYPCIQPNSLLTSLQPTN